VCLSWETVHWHLQKIRKEFDVHTSRELLLAADMPVAADQPTVRFSPRGREVMELFMRGRTYRQIAQCLGISLSGVQRHREKMLQQNNCESMLALIARYKAQLAAEQAETREGVSNEGALWNRKNRL
jgi:DNA-binding CsgD family transcriptional regulator